MPWTQIICNSRHFGLHIFVFESQYTQLMPRIDLLIACVGMCAHVYLCALRSYTHKMSLIFLHYFDLFSLFFYSLIFLYLKLFYA